MSLKITQQLRELVIQRALSPQLTYEELPCRPAPPSGNRKLLPLGFKQHQAQ